MGTEPTTYDKAHVARAFAPPIAFFILLGFGSALALRAQGIAMSPQMLTYGLGAAGIAAAALLVGWHLLGVHSFTAFATLATVAAMSPGSVLFSYWSIAASAPFPTADARLAAIDAALDFDWSALLAFVGARPALAYVLGTFYHGTIVGLVYVLAFLCVARRPDRLIEFLWLFSLAAFAANTISIFLPAAGAFVLHAPGNEIRGAIPPMSGLWHLAHFNALREGLFGTFDPYQAQGLITFPSFHTVSALLIPIALRGYGPITTTAWVAAGAIVVSTLPIGGHYLIDLIAGAGLTFALFPAAQWIVAASFRPARPGSCAEPQRALS